METEKARVAWDGIVAQGPFIEPTRARVVITAEGNVKTEFRDRDATGEGRWTPDQFDSQVLAILRAAVRGLTS